jgi:hypothetical protein
MGISLKSGGIGLIYRLKISIESICRVVFCGILC